MAEGKKTAKKTVARKRSAPKKAARSARTHQIGGRTLELQTFGGKERVLLDGKELRHLRAGEHFLMFDDAYAEPNSSLLAAAEAFVKSLAPKKREEGGE